MPAKDRLHQLYEADETAWLEETIELLRARECVDLDFENLIEFLESAVERDRREVRSRLVDLMACLLRKELRSWMEMGSVEGSAFVQRHHLQSLLKSPSLALHALETLPDAYQRAVAQAAAETGMEERSFPPACPYKVEQLLADDER